MEPLKYKTRHKLIKARTYKLIKSFNTSGGLGVEHLNKLALNYS